MTEPYYLSIDPGKTSGWVTWDSNGNMLKQGQTKGPIEFESLLEELSDSVRVAVVEDFTLYRSHALQQSGSKMETSKLIGVIESWCRRNDVNLVMQPASILSIAQLWSGVKMPKNHAKSHWVSAYNHGYYYLIKKNIRKLELRN